MQIGSFIQPHKARCAEIKAPDTPPASSVEPLDTFETAQGVGSAVTYKLLKLKAKLMRKMSSGLSDQPKVNLSKPLVCVQGFRSKPGGFAPLLDHLTADGKNGGRAYYVKGGQFFLDPEFGRTLYLPGSRPQWKGLVYRPEDKEETLRLLRGWEVRERWRAIRDHRRRARLLGRRAADVASALPHEQRHAVLRLPDRLAVRLL